MMDILSHLFLLPLTEQIFLLESYLYPALPAYLELNTWTTPLHRYWAAPSNISQSFSTTHTT